MEYKYTGIVIGKRDVGETDRIYSLYTLEGGKIQALAKGVRKPQAKLAGFLENFTLADVTVQRTRGLGKITSSIVEKNHAFLKRDCDALINALASMRAFNRLVDLEHCDAQVFALLEEYLSMADDIASRDLSEEGRNELGILLRLAFMFKLLNALGYTLAVNSCANCGEELAPNGMRFSAEHGGVLCHDCRSHAKGAAPITANAVKLLRLFLHGEMRLVSKLKAARQDLALAQQMLRHFLQWI